jgi:hypothetical protein
VNLRPRKLAPRADLALRHWSEESCRLIRSTRENVRASRLPGHVTHGTLVARQSRPGHPRAAVCRVGVDPEMQRTREAVCENLSTARAKERAKEAAMRL